MTLDDAKSTPDEPMQRFCEGMPSGGISLGGVKSPDARSLAD
ncbi:hypothetical protein Q3O97_05465 [Ralstonia pseudosolanacearum]|nr:hypothetical protein [Ralstonia pseudosolanacearum]MDO3615288.1 hypothetical protein [Ralstonia pseudosolanacearum]